VSDHTVTLSARNAGRQESTEQQHGGEKEGSHRENSVSRKQRAGTIPPDLVLSIHLTSVRPSPPFPILPSCRARFAPVPNLPGTFDLPRKRIGRGEGKRKRASACAPAPVRLPSARSRVVVIAGVVAIARVNPPRPRGRVRAAVIVSRVRIIRIRRIR